MAKDLFHETVKRALEKDGWTVTHDPYSVFHKEEKIDYAIDLGAEKIIGAERANEKLPLKSRHSLSLH